MKRVASMVALRPEHQETYLQLHRGLPPGVADMIRSANTNNYSIFLREDLLLAYFENVGSDFAAEMTRVGVDPESRHWWQLTEPCQRPLPTAQPGEVSAEATEVCRLGEP